MFKIDKIKKTGFTLAETLITLAIIGVVAILVIPSLMTSVTDRARKTQILVSQRKFQKAAELMTLNNAMGGYYADAQDFMETFRGYLKVNMVCRVGNEPSSLPPVTTCWGDDYPGIKLDNGKVVELSSIETGQEFGTIDDDVNSWYTNTVAFLDIDGTRRIIAYNTKCKDVAPGVYSGDTSAGCIAGVADVNGSKRPNKMDVDVYLFGSAQSLGSDCPIGESLGICYYRPKQISDLIASKGFVSQSECQANMSTWNFRSEYCTYKDNSLSSDENWYAQTAKECGSRTNIINGSDLAAILNEAYNTSSFNGSVSCMNTSIAMTDDIAKRLAKFGIPDPRVAGTVCIATSGANSSARTVSSTCIYSWGTSCSSKVMFGASNTPVNSYFFCKKFL